MIGRWMCRYDNDDGDAIRRNMALKEISHGTISPSELSAVPPPFRLIGLMRRGHRDGGGWHLGGKGKWTTCPAQPTYGNVLDPACLPLAGRSLALTISLIESYARERARESGLVGLR